MSLNELDNILTVIKSEKEQMKQLYLFLPPLLVITGVHYAPPQ